MLTLFLALTLRLPEPVPTSAPMSVGCLFRVTGHEVNRSLISVGGQDKAAKSWHWLSMRARWRYHPSAHTTNSLVDCQAYHFGVRPCVNQAAARNFYENYPTGVWHQVVITSTRTESRYYLDGEEVSVAAHAPPLDDRLFFDNVCFGDKCDVSHEFWVDYALSPKEIATRWRHDLGERRQHDAYQAVTADAVSEFRQQEGDKR